MAKTQDHKAVLFTQPKVDVYVEGPGDHGCATVGNRTEGAVVKTHEKTITSLARKEQGR